MRFIRFIAEYIRHPRRTGAVAQSSKGLAEKMAQGIDGSVNVIEFGGGTGSITTEILRYLPANGRLTCFEINPKFCEYLEKINDPRLTVINDYAQNCEKFVKNFDCIVSGLPLTVFPKEQREEILRLSSKSKRYVQFQYNPFMQKQFGAYFKNVKIKFIPLNIPPAFVYVCTNFTK